MSPGSIVGVDPGVTGALAKLTADSLDLEDMPIIDNMVNAHTLADLLHRWAPGLIVVETQQSMPKQGVTSVFTTGTNYGVILGVVGAMRIPVRHVRPTIWTRDLQLLRADKGAHRRRATDLFPAHARSFARVKDDGRADAALIARWAAEQAWRQPEVA